MTQQSFNNHVRVHPLYHHVAVPVSLALVPAAAVHLWFNTGLGSAILFVATIVLHLAIFLSRDYAKKNQDRIIRLELRLRYFQLTQKRFEEVEEQLSQSQLLALRFAGDEEFLELIRNPHTQQRSAVEIKKQIIQWTPDTMRV